MKAILEKCAVSEVNTVPNKEGKIYPKLVVVETGKLYPKALSLRIEGDPSALNALVGGIHDIHVSVEEYTGKSGPYTVYTFTGVQRQKAP